MPILGDVRYVDDAQPTLRNAPLLLAALEVSLPHPTREGSTLHVCIDEPRRFRAFELLPEAASGDALLAAVVRAGQRRSEAWKARWAAACAEAPDERGYVEKDAAKRDPAFVRAFVRGAAPEFEGGAWLPPGLDLGGEAEAAGGT
jgi:hypothetical protein